MLFFALLVAYPWWVLTIGTLLYLGSLPFGWLSYRANERKWAAANAATRGADRRRRPPGDAAGCAAGAWRAIRPIPSVRPASN